MKKEITYQDIKNIRWEDIRFGGHVDADLVKREIASIGSPLHVITYLYELLDKLIEEDKSNHEIKIYSNIPVTRKIEMLNSALSKYGLHLGMSLLELMTLGLPLTTNDKKAYVLDKIFSGEMTIEELRLDSLTERKIKKCHIDTVSELLSLTYDDFEHIFSLFLHKPRIYDYTTGLPPFNNPIYDKIIEAIKHIGIEELTLNCAEEAREKIALSYMTEEQYSKLNEANRMTRSQFLEKISQIIMENKQKEQEKQKKLEEKIERKRKLDEIITSDADESEKELAKILLMDFELDFEQDHEDILAPNFTSLPVEDEEWLVEQLSTINEETKTKNTGRTRK